MGSTRISLILAVAIAIATNSYAGTPYTKHILYVNPERTGHIEIEHGSMVSGPIDPMEGQEGDSIQLDREAGYYILDCSSKLYRCVQSGRIVLAVPRAPLPKSKVYAVNGTRFLVEKCYRKTGKSCRVALIRAECDLAINKDTCVLKTAGYAKNAIVRPLSYFIYNEDYGITAFGWSDADFASGVDGAKLARSYILQGNYGLLKN